jgi:hypothetical protein
MIRAFTVVSTIFYIRKGESTLRPATLRWVYVRTSRPAYGETAISKAAKAAYYNRAPAKSPQSG